MDALLDLRISGVPAAVGFGGALDFLAQLLRSLGYLFGRDAAAPVPPPMWKRAYISLLAILIVLFIALIAGAIR